jgi:ferredoxin
MPKLTIDNRTIEVAPGTTILEAAKQAGIEIPTLCPLEGCTPATSCMVCVVKRTDNGRLVPSCAARVEDGLAVESETDEVRQARRDALELLLSDHPGDCLGPCQTVCPAHMDIPRMLRAAGAGDSALAARVAREALVLPATLGRICPAPCEKGCRRGDLDAPISIRLSHRRAAETDLATGPALPAKHLNVPDSRVPLAACPPVLSGLPTGGQAARATRRVAIIGSGPAGLAAAWHLLQEGVACTVFDDHPQAGGALRHGVPEDRLPRGVLDAEIELVAKLGAEFRLGVRVGRDVSLADLRRDFQAVILATGAAVAGGPPLGVEGLPPDVTTDRKTSQTSVPGVFVAGSGRHQKLAVRAVADGTATAHSVMQHLAGQSVTTPKRTFTTRLHQPTADEMAALAAAAGAEGRVEPTGGQAAGLTPDEARREAARCLHCDCRKADACRLRRWADAYDANPARHAGTRRRFEQDRRHDSVIYEPGKCIACGLCVQITERAKEPLGLAFLGRGFNVRVDVPLGESMAKGLQKVAEECVAACPTGALAKKEEVGSGK